MKKISFFRFSVFWIWILTLAISIVIFITTMIINEMTFKEIDESLTHVTGLLLPQLSIMIAFFFGTDKGSQEKMLKKDDKGIVKLTVGLSLFYHLSFWIVMSLALCGGIFGDTIDANTYAATKIMGFLSMFGLAPVAYLFVSKKKS